MEPLLLHFTKPQFYPDHSQDFFFLIKKNLIFQWVSAAFFFSNDNKGWLFYYLDVSKSLGLSKLNILLQYVQDIRAYNEFWVHST